MVTITKTYVTPVEAAEMLNLSKSHIYYLINSGYLKRKMVRDNRGHRITHIKLDSLRKELIYRAK